MQYPEDWETLLKVIREEIASEIIKNLEISFEAGDTVFGDKEPGTLTLKYKGEEFYCEYVDI